MKTVWIAVDVRDGKAKVSWEQGHHEYGPENPPEGYELTDKDYEDSRYVQDEVSEDVVDWRPET